MILYALLLIAFIPAFYLCNYSFICLVALGSMDSSLSGKDSLIVLGFLLLQIVMLILVYYLIPYLISKLSIRFKNGKNQNTLLGVIYWTLNIFTVLFGIFLMYINITGIIFLNILISIALILIGIVINRIKIAIIKTALRKTLSESEKIESNVSLQLNKMPIKLSKKEFATIILFIFLLYPLALGVQTCSAMNFLCEKYDENINSFEIVKFVPSHLKIDKKANNDIKIYSPCWEIKYNNTIFNVQKLEFKNIYFDDYELEQVSKLLTDYAKNNIDQNIICVHTSTKDFYNISSLDKELRYSKINSDNILDLIVVGTFDIDYKLDKELSQEDLVSLEYELNSSFKDSYYFKIANTNTTITDNKKRSHKTSDFNERNSFLSIASNSSYYHYYNDEY